MAKSLMISGSLPFLLRVMRLFPLKKKKPRYRKLTKFLNMKKKSQFQKEKNILQFNGNTCPTRQKQTMILCEPTTSYADRKQGVSNFYKSRMTSILSLRRYSTRWKTNQSPTHRFNNLKHMRVIGKENQQFLLSTAVPKKI